LYDKILLQLKTEQGLEVEHLKTKNGQENKFDNFIKRKQKIYKNLSDKQLSQQILEVENEYDIDNLRWFYRPEPTKIEDEKSAAIYILSCFYFMGNYFTRHSIDLVITAYGGNAIRRVLFTYIKKKTDIPIRTFYNSPLSGKILILDNESYQLNKKHLQAFEETQLLKEEAQKYWEEYLSGNYSFGSIKKVTPVKDAEKDIARGTPLER
jgi:hypothetical protein